MGIEEAFASVKEVRSSMGLEGREGACVEERRSRGKEGGLVGRRESSNTAGLTLMKPMCSRGAAPRSIVD